MKKKNNQLDKISSPMINKQTRLIQAHQRPFLTLQKPLRLQGVRAKHDIIYRSSQLAFFRETSSFLQTSRKNHMSCEAWMFADLVDEFLVLLISFEKLESIRPIFEVGLRHGRWVFQRLKRSWSSETSRGVSTLENVGMTSDIQRCFPNVKPRVITLR